MSSFLNHNSKFVSQLCEIQTFKNSDFFSQVWLFFSELQVYISLLCYKLTIVSLHLAVLTLYLAILSYIFLQFFPQNCEIKKSFYTLIIEKPEKCCLKSCKQKSWENIMAHNALTFWPFDHSASHY